MPREAPVTSAVLPVKDVIGATTATGGGLFRRPDLSLVAFGHVAEPVAKPSRKIWGVAVLGEGDLLFGGQRRVDDRGGAGGVDVLEPQHGWGSHLGDLAGQLQRAVQ